MAVQYRNLEDEYVITTNENLATEITIGDAQPDYATSTFLGKNFIGSSL